MLIFDLLHFLFAVVLPACPAHVAADAPIVNGDRRFAWKSQTPVSWTDNLCNDGPMGRVPVILDEPARVQLVEMLGVLLT